MRSPAVGSDRLTVLAFLGVIVIGGSNAVAIRLGNAELTPFLGATMRFGLAAILLLAVAAARRTPLPAGPARAGVVLYGLTAFAGSYAALYWGLVEAPATTAMIVIATVPLLTLLIAAAVGQERLSARGLAGAVVALGGIVLIVGDQLGAATPGSSLAALFLGASFIALSGVIVKQIPPGHPVAANGFGMAVGAAVLAALSRIGGEPWTLPTGAATWASLGYLSVFGSVGLFMLVLYVLARWSASATSYATLAMPLVTVGLAAVILDETVSPLFVAGAGIALVGVYLGVSNRQPGPVKRPGEPDAARVAATATPAVAVPAVAAPALAAGEIDCRPPGC